MMHPYTIVEGKVSQLAAKYNLPPEMVGGILREFVESLHEASFKGSVTEALKGVYFSLNSEAAWHFWGIIYSNLSEGGDSDLLSDHRSMWHETALRLDSRMKRFCHIVDRWSEERAHESEQ